MNTKNNNSSNNNDKRRALQERMLEAQFEAVHWKNRRLEERVTGAILVAACRRGTDFMWSYKSENSMSIKHWLRFVHHDDLYRWEVEISRILEHVGFTPDANVVQRGYLVLSNDRVMVLCALASWIRQAKEAQADYAKSFGRRELANMLRKNAKTAEVPACLIAELQEYHDCTWGWAFNDELVKEAGFPF